MAEAAAPTAASSRLPSPTPIIESQRRRSSSRRASQPFGRRSEGRRAESVTGATGHDFRATYEAKPTYGLQQGPAREVQLSQARNKALEKLGIGVSNAVNKAEEKPWISLLRPWFPSPDTEHDYQEAAYELHRRFLFQLLMFAGCSYLAITVGWTALAVRGQWQLVGRGALRGERAATIALRPLFGAACLLTAMLVLRSSLGPRPASVLCVAIIYLGAAVPFVDHARTDAGAAAPEEGVEVMLMYLIAYQLLVPIFQIRYIAAAMWTLMLAQQVYGLARYRESLAAHTTLQLREFARAMILNLLGTALGVVAEKNRRRNFMGAMLYHEEVVLMTAVRNDVQRLLLNTLPEPIVKEVASGKTEIAHRYESVTVLQADMVGFTPLSASHPPAEVLGIISDIFGQFDELADKYGVHKVKTIGDAYVACAGAFPVSTVTATVDSPEECAERTVNMALAMQQAVIDKALSTGLAISMRVGVHTGMVIGGIIGTVRFHFDMWGNGVIGAMRMEELGAKGRVHISNTTAQLLGDKLPLEAAHEMERSFAEKYRIERSFFVDGANIDLAKYAVYTPDVQITTEYDLTELLGQSPIAVEQQIASAIAPDGSEDLFPQQQSSISTFFSKFLSSISRPGDGRRSVGGAPGRFAGRFLSRVGGRGDAIVRDLAEDVPKEKGAHPWRQMSEELAMERPTFGRSVTSRLTGGEASGAGGAARRGTSTTGGGGGGGGQRDQSQYFFAGKKDPASKDADSGSGGEAYAAERQAAEKHMVKQCDALTALVFGLGLYDLLFFFDTARLLGWERVFPLFACRYFGLFPLCLLMRILLRRIHLTSVWRINAVGATIVSVVSLGIVALSVAAPVWLHRCDDGGSGVAEALLPCPASLLGGESGFASTTPEPPQSPPPHMPPLPPLVVGLPPSPPLAPTALEHGQCLAGVADGAHFCARLVASDYLITLGAVHSFFHYSLVHARLSALLAAGSIGSLAQLTIVALVDGILSPSFGDTGSSSSSNSQRSAVLMQLINPMVAIVVSHLFGVLAYLSHRATLRQHQLLATRQQRLLGMIRLETEQCEQLLKNILPPHLLGTLAGMVQLHANKLLDNTHLLAQQYQDCTFVFAKIGRLSEIVNDPKRDTKLVMRTLQKLFDAFDKLCDLYRVQKVRKTANEYYLVAAGLPNPKLLPTPEDRACGIAAFAFAIIGVMDVLNIELRAMGVQFTLQVGMNSGSAVAGIIGHKTFQYDLCGDAVNTTARMCSYSKPGYVHVSEASYRLLANRYPAISRGEIEVKGKGKMSTYYLINLPTEECPAQLALTTSFGAAQKALPPVDEMEA